MNHQATLKRRQQQQGQGKPIISTEWEGHRFVAVGNKLFASSKWQTFHDFLSDYLFRTIGHDWIAAESEKPDARLHPIALWTRETAKSIELHGQSTGRIKSAPMTGAARAFLNLSYNLYMIQHHAGAQSEQILDRLVSRLRRRTEFWGALYETYVAAAFIKAGFELEYEDESVSTSTHAEFIAIHPGTSKAFWVEAKARVRDNQGDGSDEVRRLAIGNKLYKALKKPTDLPRVVFIEVSLPDKIKDRGISGWMRTALDQLREKEETMTVAGGPAPSAYVFITNHVYHHRLHEITEDYYVVADGFKIRDFGPEVPFASIRALKDAEKRHEEMFALMEALRTHQEIPSTFDGEIPELLYGSEEGNPRLIIGRSYMVPDSDGTEVLGRLCDATVDVKEKTAMGVYQLEDGKSILVSCPLTDDEVAAYVRYPDTFFESTSKGQPVRQPDDVLGLFEFFHATYKKTPKAKLLDFMEAWPNIDKLRTLPQEELAFIYCEAAAVSAFERRS